jgi:hypothetical protein
MSLSKVQSVRRRTGVVLGALVVGAIAAPGVAQAADTTPPKVKITASPAQGTTGPVSIGIRDYFNGTVYVGVDVKEGAGESGIATVRCVVDSGNVQSFPVGGAKSFGAVASFTAVGRHVVQCEADDVAGNSSPTAAIQIVIDKSAPTVTATSNQSPVNGGTVSLNLQASDPDQGSGFNAFAGSGVKYMTISIDGGAPFQHNSANFSTQFVGPGSHTVTYTATDKLGNTSAQESITVMLDTTKPDLTITGGTTPVTVTSPFGDSDAGPTILKGTATDNRGVTKVSVRFRNVADSDVAFDKTYLASCPGCGPTNSPVNWSLNLSTLGLPAGKYETIVTAYDQAGNTRQARGPVVSVY